MTFGKKRADCRRCMPLAGRSRSFRSAMSPVCPRARSGLSRQAHFGSRLQKPERASHPIGYRNCFDTTSILASTSASSVRSAAASISSSWPSHVAATMVEATKSCCLLHAVARVSRDALTRTRRAHARWRVKGNPPYAGSRRVRSEYPPDWELRCRKRIEIGLQKS